jgi:hypothetical protein
MITLMECKSRLIGRLRVAVNRVWDLAVGLFGDDSVCLAFSVVTHLA